MITSNQQTLRQMGMGTEPATPVRFSLGLGRYSDNFRGWHVSKWTYRGAGPAGRWCWMAESEDGLIVGETQPTFRDDQYGVTLQAMDAIDKMLDNPQFAQAVHGN